MARNEKRTARKPATSFSSFGKRYEHHALFFSRQWPCCLSQGCKSVARYRVDGFGAKVKSYRRAFDESGKERMARCNKTATHGSCRFPCFFHVSRTTIVRKGEAVAGQPLAVSFMRKCYQPPLRQNEPLHRYRADYADRCWGKDRAILSRVLASFVNLLTIHNDIFGSADADPHFSPLDFHDRYVDMVVNNDLFSDFSR